MAPLSSYYAGILRGYPAIDNHAHPLLTEENRNRLDFEGLTSEVEGAALKDTVHTLAHTAARGDLLRLYDLPRHSSWEDIKKHRAARAYDELCRLCIKKAKIQCILINDGLGGVKEMAEGYRWHNRYTHSPTRRIVRVEVVAEDIIMETPGTEGLSFSVALLTSFIATLHKLLVASAKDPSVAGFKSVICYRTGLDVSAVPDPAAEAAALFSIDKPLQSNVPLQLADKPLDDLVVRTTLEVVFSSESLGA